MTDIAIDTTDRITTLRFTRPAKKNALTVEMYEQLTAALATAAADTSVRAVVITGSAECFTSGNDIADFARANAGGEVTAPLDFLRAIVNFDKPLLAAVSGVAIGIGTTLLLHCDLVVASPTAKFKTPFVALGLVPEGGSSLLLPALIGARRATQMLLLGEQIDAPTALAWGLVNEVADDAYAAALAKAKVLAACAPNAIRSSKVLMGRPTRAQVLETIEHEGKVFGAQLRSPEAMEAFQAFMARRPADFSRF